MVNVHVINLCILHAGSLTITITVSIAVAVVMFALLVILVVIVTVIVVKYYKKGMALCLYFTVCTDSSEIDSATVVLLIHCSCWTCLFL